MLVNEKQQRTIYLGDLSAFCNEQELYEVFKPFGEIQEIKLMRSKHDGSCLGYGFMTFATIEQAFNAMESMHGKMLIGRQLK